MPNAETVRTLIKARFPRSMEAWRERLERALHDGGHEQPVLVRLALRVVPAQAVREGHGATAWLARPDVQTEAANALGIKILRHLGADAFVVELGKDEDENQLALQGHLDVTRGNFRMIAI